MIMNVVDTTVYYPFLELLAPTGEDIFVPEIY